MNQKVATNEEALAALDAGIAAASELPPGAEPELLSVPAPEVKDEPAEPVADAPVDKPAEVTDPEAPETPDAPAGTEPAAETPPPQTDAAKAEADAAAADAEEAKGLGFKNQKGVEAYQRVKSEARTATRERDELRVQIEQDLQPRAEAFTKFRDHMESIGCKPEQFGLAVSMIQAMNSGDPKMLGALEQELEGQLRQLREKLGTATADGRELYEADPELAQAVADGDITVKHANELAKVRRLDAAGTAHANATAERERQAAEARQAENTAAQQAIDEAAGELDVLGQHLLKIDPEGFKHKRDAALAQFLQVRDQTPPAKWPMKFREIYDNLPGPPKAPVRKPAGNVPLRAGGTPGGAAPVSSSPMDALNAGLEAARNGATW